MYIYNAILLFMTIRCQCRMQTYRQICRRQTMQRFHQICSANCICKRPLPDRSNNYEFHPYQMVFHNAFLRHANSNSIRNQSCKMHLLKRNWKNNAKISENVKYENEIPTKTMSKTIISLMYVGTVYRNNINNI